MAKTKPMAAAAAGEKKKSKGKKKGKNGPAKVAMKARGAAAEERSNPFEAIWSRRKFDVLGKKRKGEERRVSRSRSEAIRKRENTLLKEFMESGKSSVFHDRRIGERDDALPEFDKAILRQQRERLAKLKRESKYNLSDDDEDEINVHNMLSEKDDFDEEVPLDDGSDEEGKMVLSKKRLSLQSDDHPSVTDLPQETHQGQKSKKEVMSEIISKSKFYKAQRAKEREEDEHLVDKLDSDFASLAQTQALLSLTDSAKVKVNKNDSSAGLTGKEIFNKLKADTYEKLVKEMVMDQRARPSDRTKTPEEIAQEEKERLEKLEEERQKRMLGTADSSDEDDDNEDDKHMKLGNSKPISGDDLGDSFSLDESIGKKKGWVDEIYEREGRKIGDDAAASDDGESDDENASDDGADDEEDSEEDSSDNDFGNMSARDWEQSDDDEVDVGDDEMEDFKEKEQEINGKVVEKVAHNLKGESDVKPQVKDGSIPFVIDAPNDLKDLSSLLDGRSEAEIVEIISRIRTCNSIRLAAENRRKMQVFYGVLLQYFATLATQSPVKFRIIDTLVKPLIEMSGETPYFAAICARERLIHTRTRLCEDIKVPGKSSWPNLKTLLLLRLWSLIFPCSDFRHVVATPLLLLMCEYLMRCPIQSGRDVAVGSFLCSMVLVVTKESKKFCPEAVGFLQSLLVTSLKGKVGTHLHNQINDQFMELKTLKPWLSIHDQVHEVNPVNILEIVGMDPDAPYFSSDNFKAGVLLSVVECLRGFVIIHEGLCSFPEIFLPISSLLQEILERSELPDSLQDIFHEIIDLVKKISDEHHASREPLRMRKKKPEPIKQLNPKFEENYIKGLDYDPDRERAQMKKLRKRVKSEMKGAKRELQKDNYFLSAVKEKERMKRDEERAEMYGKAMAFLQEQESAFKSGQLGKGKGRKRRR
ncbi:nucleolar protein 14 isoform X1 [Sorghum bicolor]|uniref:nucleolar protein 14 isoform X1 n=1 Tax=Sorghum bicolor TaxID=4558 RepID=UPI000B423B3D|nr:nucleolar protein 14 isoform X1 [Sorghum bicolor]|eukprot:XP_021315627.1 nucleolar protein 14 isoform X1 [Sorghum bicolor]